MAQQPPVGQDLLTVEASRSHSDAPLSVRLLWTSDQPDAEILHDNKKHSQERDIQAPGGIWTSNTNKGATTNTQLRLLDHHKHTTQTARPLHTHNSDRSTTANTQLRPLDHFKHTTQTARPLQTHNLDRSTTANNSDRSTTSNTQLWPLDHCKHTT